MQIQSGQEALFIAIEMERGAVQTYERALMLTDSSAPALAPLRQQLTTILADERQHLKQFQALYMGLGEAMERQMTLSAIASSILFEGGLMGAVRLGMLQDQESLLRFAQQAEEKAAGTYRAFAAACGNPETAAILNGIAAEEDKHLQTLRNFL